ncbi:MAG: hypothetical protein HY579_00370 [Nitrospinae bacterium]|nr:hypothetical protein [Nitrospinota bacterium]
MAVIEAQENFAENGVVARAGFWGIKAPRRRFTTRNGLINWFILGLTQAVFYIILRPLSNKIIKIG